MHKSHSVWLDRYPWTAARLRQWISLAVLALLWPSVILAFAIYARFGLGIFLCLLVYALELVCAIAFAFAFWLERGLYQICPMCHRKRLAGYQRCLCGYPER